jgi:outer membrane protein TolC
VYGDGPAIHLPIFDAGRLRANLRGKASDLDVAIETYNGAVVDAVRDVADQLGSLQSLERQRREQTLAQTAAELSFDLATQRYRAGLGTYLTVLNAESSVLTARRLSADLLAQRSTPCRADPCAGGGYVAPLATGDAAASRTVLAGH